MPSSKPTLGVNDLQSQFPDIASEAFGWDPETVTIGSNQKKEWKCDIGHIYSSVIADRTGRGSKCSICSGRQVLKGFNDLNTKFPDIASEAYGWDPETVTSGSSQKKKWICGEGHIYSSVIAARTKGGGCPICSSRQALEGYNDLKTRFPDIAKEAYKWDPQTVMPGTNQKKDWKCDLGHIYSSSVNHRTSNGSGCPVCSGRQVLAGFNDLKTKFPNIAAEAYKWDPSTVVAGTDKSKDWKCSKGHIYTTMVTNRTNSGSGCPFCENQKVLAGFNDLQTKFPDIAAEAFGWDPSTLVAGTKQKRDWKCKEGHLYNSAVSGRTSGGRGCPVCAGQQVLTGFNDLQTKFPNIAAEAYEWDPTTITTATSQKRNWRCIKGHIYSSMVSNRTRGEGCPVCSGRQVLAGFNDLKTKFPDIAAEAYEWDPSTVVAGTPQKRNWSCIKGHIYSSMVSNRTNGNGCPFCSGLKVLAGFNDLKTKCPDIAAEAYEWDPSTVVAGTPQKRNWRCIKGHIYSSMVSNRTNHNSGCPFCSGNQVLAGYNDLETKCPDIAAEAYGWDPTTVTAGSNKSKDWKCSKGHIYTTMVTNRTSNGQGCPTCAEYGFNPDKDAWFYLMERPGEQQLGISNVITDRLRTHESNGWSLIEHTTVPSKGQKVLDTETAFKKWLKKEIGLMEGTTENWSTTKMEVQSLAELKARSGIETDLF